MTLACRSACWVKHIVHPNGNGLCPMSRQLEQWSLPLFEFSGLYVQTRQGSQVLWASQLDGCPWRCSHFATLCDCLNQFKSNCHLGHALDFVTLENWYRGYKMPLYCSVSSSSCLQILEMNIGEMFWSQQASGDGWRTFLEPVWGTS